MALCIIHASENGDHKTPLYIKTLGSCIRNKSNSDISGWNVLQFQNYSMWQLVDLLLLYENEGYIVLALDGHRHGQRKAWKDMSTKSSWKKQKNNLMTRKKYMVESSNRHINTANAEQWHNLKYKLMKLLRLLVQI